jgi:phage terminase large subunit-like protein
VNATSSLVEQDVEAGLGSACPRLSTAPLRELNETTSLGFDVARFAELVLRLPLMPWQVEFVVRALELVDVTDSFGRVLRKRLRFRTVLLLVARQNGKSTVMIVLALYFMLVYQPGELVLGTAQNLETSESTWEQGLDLVKDVPALAKLIPATRGEVRTNGKTALNLTNGSCWKVAPANRKGGRSKSAKLVMLDEFREHLTTDAWAAISNTTLAKRDALVLCVSNAGDARSVPLKTQREKALARLNDPETSLGLFEWSAPEDCDADDRRGWLMANPACGHPNTGMDLGTLSAARDASTENDWKTENLCQWVTVMAAGPWREGRWDELADPLSKIDPESPLVISADTSLDRATSYVAVAGWAKADTNRVHVEVISMGPGNAWVAGWIDRRFDRLGPAHVVVQGPNGSPAGDVGQALIELGVPVSWAKGPAVTGSATGFYDAVRDGHIVHLGQPVLDMAALTAQLRFAGDGVIMFDRRRSPVDVAPLIAAAQAWFYLTTDVEPMKRSAYEDEEMVVI